MSNPNPSHQIRDKKGKFAPAKTKRKLAIRVREVTEVVPTLKDMERDLWDVYLPVHEIFRSVQGEGMFMGVPALFIRLWGCNLKCSFCDTPQQVQDRRLMSVTEIVERAEKGEHVVITGGEPMLHPITSLLRELTKKECIIEVETNGSRFHPMMAAHFVVSPKFDSLTPDYRQQLKHWSNCKDSPWARSVTFKFVVRNTDDFKRVMDFQREFKLRDDEIVLQPCATTAHGVIAGCTKVLSMVKHAEKNYRVLPRLHILLDEK